MTPQDLAPLLRREHCGMFAQYMEEPFALTVVEVIAKHYGLDPLCSLVQIHTAMTNHPEKLKILEYSHQEILIEYFHTLSEKMALRLSNWVLVVMGILLVLVLVVFYHMAS